MKQVVLYSSIMCDTMERHVRAVAIAKAPRVPGNCPPYSAMSEPLANPFFAKYPTLIA